MSIYTTLYVNDVTMRLIEDAVAQTGKKRNQIINLLMRKSMADKTLSFRTGSTISYQRSDATVRWRTLHVVFKDDEADFYRDLRNILKRSVSLILAQAAREYLREIIKNSGAGKKNDNYPFENYLLSRWESDGLVFWIICWGFPPEPEKYLHL